MVRRGEVGVREHAIRLSKAHHHSQAYPDASSEVIEVDGTPAGRLYLAVWPTEIRIVDITLLPEYRGHGIGGALLRQVLEQGRASGCSVSIHVELESRPPVVQTSGLRGNRAARHIYAHGVEVAMMERRVFLAGMSAAVAGTAVFSPCSPLAAAAPASTRAVLDSWLGSELQLNLCCVRSGSWSRFCIFTIPKRSGNYACIKD